MPSIIVHGGAKTISDDKAKANTNGCLAGVEAGWTMAQMAIETLKSKVKGEAGCILLDHQGRVGWSYNSQDMAVAYMTSDMDRTAVFTRK